MRLTILAALAITASPPRQSPPLPGTGPNGQPPATIVAEPAALLIAACDADGDARTSRAELAACLARGFAAADTTHAGKISFIDYGDWALKWLGDRNALPSPFTIDADNDDLITLKELQDQFDRLFTRFDSNRDNYATRAELLTIRAGPGDPDGGRNGGQRRRR